MNALPQCSYLVEMCSRRVEYFPYVGPLRIRGPNRIPPACQCDTAVISQVNDRLRLAQISMDVSWWMIIGINHKKNAIEPERSHPISIT